MIDKGIRIVPHWPVPRLVEAARAAEGWGCRYAWVCDEGFARDVFVTMAAIAHGTRTIKVGTGITNPYTRHPTVTAIAIASLHESSGGRAFLGLGAGGSLVLDPLNLERRAPIAACRDAVQIARLLWSGRRVTYEGRTARLAAAQMGLEPQTIEIWMAGRGPQILSLAAAVADGVWLDSLPKFALQPKIELIRDAAARAGRRPRIAASVFIATDAVSLDEIRPYFTFAVADSPPDVRERLGVSDTAAERIRQVMNTEGIGAAAPLISDDLLREFVFCGTPSRCAGEIRELAQSLGVDQVILATDIGNPAFASAGEALRQV